MVFRLSVISFLLACSSWQAVAGGIVMGATRVVFEGNKKEASITVANRGSDTYYLVQSWIEDSSENKVSTFIVTPPLFRLKENKEGILRIVRAGGQIPEDRESVYWLSVKAIPPKNENASENTLQLAIKTRMKLFYRPAGIVGTPEQAQSSLKWSKDGAKIKVTNDAAYSVTLGEVFLNKQKIQNVDLVPAFSSVSYTVPQGFSTGGFIEYKAINDYGGFTDLVKSTVQ